LVQNVPALALKEELLKLFALYGKIVEWRHLDESTVEEFTEAYWIQYDFIESAQVVKRKLDDYPFYGSPLRVTYAPEFESVADTTDKLLQRKTQVLNLLQTPTTKVHIEQGAAITSRDFDPLLLPFQQRQLLPEGAEHLEETDASFNSKKRPLVLALPNAIPVLQVPSPVSKLTFKQMPE